MLELLKNIGLGIFVNGAYALQFTENTFEGFLGSLEGIITMLFAIYTPPLLLSYKLVVFVILFTQVDIIFCTG